MNKAAFLKEHGFTEREMEFLIPNKKRFGHYVYTDNDTIWWYVAFLFAVCIIGTIVNSII